MIKNPNIKGIRIRTLNLTMLVLSLIIFCLILYTTIIIWKEYNNFIRLNESYITWERAAHQVHLGSDKLTEQSRLYTQTGQKKYADNFFYELYDERSREKASEYLAKLNLHPEENPNLQKALKLSEALTKLEIYAIRLVAEAQQEDLLKFPAAVRNVRLSTTDAQLSPKQKMEHARQLLFTSDYQQSKNKIYNMLNGIITQTLATISVEQAEQKARLGSVLMEQRIMLVALCILNILTFAMIIILIVKPLQVYLRCIRDDKMLEIFGAYEFKHLALTYNDIFALKERHDKMLKYKAEHDPLTGLLNRSAFDSLRQLLACDAEPTALLLIDVDNFKQVNDGYGHEIGDKALKQVAKLLEHSFRADDLCIRLGGDEFAVVLRSIDVGLQNRIENKIAYINQRLQKPNDDLPKLSISVGVAVSKNGFPDTLYQDADVALYEVKEAGRCGCRFYKAKPGDANASTNS